MPPEAKKLLTDMLDAGKYISDFIAAKTFPDMQNDVLLRSGIYYQFTIIGEALSKLRAFDDTIVDRISEAHRIIGFRNQVVHGYAKIDDKITWRIISEKLPILMAEVSGLLAE